MREHIQSYDQESTFSIFVPMKLKKRGGASMVILPKEVPTAGIKVINDNNKPNYDHRMINALAKAYKWQKQMEKQDLNMSQLARRENLSDRYISRILRLNYLAPDIVITILEGRQPRDLKLQDLTSKAIPNLWEEQKTQFDFKK